MIANRRSVKAVFLTIEKDDYKQPPTNHVHPAIATSKPIEPDQLSDKITKAINLKKKHIGNIEPIRGKEETLRYISKHIRKNDRNINIFFHHQRNDIDLSITLWHGKNKRILEKE